MHPPSRMAKLTFSHSSTKPRFELKSWLVSFRELCAPHRQHSRHPRGARAHTRTPSGRSALPPAKFNHARLHALGRVHACANMHAGAPYQCFYGL